jgi:hypothetical protein
LLLITIGDWRHAHIAPGKRSNQNFLRSTGIG